MNLYYKYLNIFIARKIFGKKIYVYYPFILIYITMNIFP